MIPKGQGIHCMQTQVLKGWFTIVAVTNIRWGILHNVTKYSFIRGFPTGKCSYQSE
jgi:hypothetical protein